MLGRSICDPSLIEVFIMRLFNRTLTIYASCLASSLNYSCSNHQLYASSSTCLEAQVCSIWLVVETRDRTRIPRYLVWMATLSQVAPIVKTRQNDMCWINQICPHMHSCTSLFDPTAYCKKLSKACPCSAQTRWFKDL